MRTFDQLADRLLYEAVDGRTIGFFPGAFKPPHVGHYETARSACEACDEVYVLVSPKSRDLNTRNIAVTSTDSGDVKDCDASRYMSFKSSTKYTGNLNSINIEPCARLSSASGMRAAISTEDRDTIRDNLPTGVDVNKITDILFQSLDAEKFPENFGKVTIDQTILIWKQFARLLVQNTNISPENLHIITTKGSPVTLTYEMVYRLNGNPNEFGDTEQEQQKLREVVERANRTNVLLYVGS